MALDPIDRRLALALRARGRSTYAELGRLVGLSAPAVHERVGKLGTHFEQARADVDQIRISTEAIVRRGDKVRAVDLGEPPAELQEPTLPLRASSTEGA